MVFNNEKHGLTGPRQMSWSLTTTSMADLFSGAVCLELLHIGQVEDLLEESGHIRLLLSVALQKRMF